MPVERLGFGLIAAVESPCGAELPVKGPWRVPWKLASTHRDNARLPRCVRGTVGLGTGVQYHDRPMRIGQQLCQHQRPATLCVALEQRHAFGRSQICWEDNQGHQGGQGVVVDLWTSAHVRGPTFAATLNRVMFGIEADQEPRP